MIPPARAGDAPPGQGPSGQLPSGQVLPLAPARRRILVVANPTAGNYRRGVLEAVAGHLAEAEVPIEVRLTRRAGDIAETCAHPPADVATIVVAGGDGSINEAIAGFERVANPPALAVVPFGTANVLAHELGLPRDARTIAEVIRRGRTADLYYGRANGRPFVLMASAGYDAAVVHSLPIKLKRRLGKLAYAITAIRLMFGPRTPDIRVILDGETIVCRLAVATNVSRYGGPFVVCPQESALRPGLHLIALTRDDPPAVFRFGFALLVGRLAHASGIVMRPIESARFEADEPVPCQIDGDTFGTTPVVVEQAQRPVRIILP